MQSEPGPSELTLFPLPLEETEEDVTEVPEAEKLMDVLWNIIHIRKPGEHSITR